MQLWNSQTTRSLSIQPSQRVSMADARGVPNAILVVLNLHNYEEWSIQVKTYLMAEGLWDVVGATAETPNQENTCEGEFRDWRKNSQALHAIQSSCGIDVYGFIRDSRMAKDAWETLARRLKPVIASKNTAARGNWFGPCRPYPRY